MTPNVAAVVSVLLPICCHIGSGMSYLCIFVEETVPLLGPMADQWELKTRLWSELDHKQLPGKGCIKNISAKFIACELWVERVGTFGVVLYRNQ